MSYVGFLNAKEKAFADNSELAYLEGRWRQSTRFVPTAEDWYPPYYHSYNDEGNLVEPTYDPYFPSLEIAGAPMARISIYLRAPEPHSPTRRMRKQIAKDYKWFIRICIWGNDDTGIERDFYVSTKEEAHEVYNWQITWMNNLAVASRLDLLKLGFVYA